MTLKSDSIKWAIEFIHRHSDGDIFPHIPEISAISNQPDGLIKEMSNRQLDAFSPQPFRRFLVPKDDLSYRQATQLHPQDSILFTAIVYEYGQGIEARRLPKDQVFSYRFEPSADKGLYGNERLWNEFWSTAAKKSENYSHVLYCDIADFYNQIYHHVVENQLQISNFPNQVTKWVIGLLESTTQGVSRGIPIGPHAAHLIAECTLIPVDNSLKASGVEFIRYVDDLVIFCDSANDARKAIYTIASTLDKQQRLMLQKHKTRIFLVDEFQEYCDRMIEDRPINEEEDKILKIIKKYSPSDPYARVTYDQVSSEDWKAFTGDVVAKIVNEYLQQEQVDYIRLRWFFRRLAQVGHSGALQVIVDHIDSLEPCLPSICSYISSIQEVPADEWETIGDQLLNFLVPDSVIDTEFARLSILSLFSKNEHLDHFAKLVQRFNSSDAHTRREILLAARTNGAADWLREHKEDYGAMDRWQRMAFVYCMSIFPKDERRYFLNKQAFPCPFEKELKKLSRDGTA